MAGYKFTYLEIEQIMSHRFVVLVNVIYTVSSSSLSSSHGLCPDLNFPLPTEKGPACLVKVIRIVNLMEMGNEVT